MGLTTQYLRYVPGSAFGLVGTERCVRFVTKYSQTGRYVAAPACEFVLIWDCKRSSKVLTLSAGIEGQVTSLEVRPPAPGSLDNTHLAVGYSDGSVVLFDIRTGTSLKFAGHRGAVTTLAWDDQGMRVASGSQDGEIVVWDVVSERGIVRLKGHQGKITRLRFLKDRSIVVSSCRDSFIKFWDLDTNHCFRTLTGHRAEVWDFVLLKNDTRLISGSSDAELRVWSLRFKDPEEMAVDDRDGKSLEPPSKMFRIDTEGEIKGQEDDTEEDDASNLEITRLGSILRSRGDRVCGLQTDGHIVACYGKSAVVDLFHVLSEEEVSAKVASRLKKARKRAREAGTAMTENEAPQLGDEIGKLPAVKAQNKLYGVDVSSDRYGSVKVLALHLDNSLAIFGTSVDAKADKNKSDERKDQEVICQLQLPGHRTEIRAVAFNSISDQIITASGESLKVWHRSEKQAIATIPCDYALSVIVVPGDRHALIGTRSGRLQLFDLGSAKMLEDIVAHEPAENETDTGVWALALTHDGRGFLSGGSDKMVKFWKFELVKDESESQARRLSFIQDKRALKVADQVTSVRCASDGFYIAVATLDNKETLYYSDTLKLYHELYGKSLPSTCMDFSTDATLIVTGSKDSSLRIYGTDFGDMRKLLKNAHQGGVTDLQFISNTHMFFSCGHDGTLKQWDADNFQRIITLQGHVGIIRCLSVCPKGAWVATCGQDRSIRLWQRTQEPLVLEDEREEERLKDEEESGMLASQRPAIAGEDGAQAVRPSTTTQETERAVDSIREALEIYREQVEAGPTATPHQLMTYVYNTADPLRFVLEVLRKIKSSELEEAVIMLPLDNILELMVVIKGLLENNWDIELASRILVLAVRINLPQLLSSPKAAPLVRSLAKLLPKRIKEFKDMIGFNAAGLRHMKDRIEERSETQMFAEALENVQTSRKKRKKKDRAVKRALLTI
ncbi:hypothetical protein C7M84_014583 [Penaeus vannamei]|uniref:Small-subunit processome Utp12 domain-containing protein n=1 Tax=Penaeus vannamei TaxID=6689 RepID=A0A3R7SMK4_PENVA|nr:WD repeat-containing protein 3-like [Penaeus vannamei]XP_027225506.1 WD repeat-containing protein 3-like [Penaeus vannamei]ROT67348.1 hypothetical protein C7M84_014583 [Penaeus vannamei]